MMSAVSGQSIQPGWEAKAELLLQAGGFLLIFFFVFFWFFRRHFWKEPEARHLFFLTILILMLVVVGKFVIFYVSKGYIPDRALFFALPSPKWSSFGWMSIASLPLCFLWFVRGKLQQWVPAHFLLSVWFMFVLFSLGVAGLREGTTGIYEPFTRTQLEYTGDEELIESVPQFLREYVSLNPQLSLHGATHPPGYALLLHLLKGIFQVEIFGLSVLMVMLGGLVVFPLYYFWRYFIPEDKLRQVLLIYAFTPSLVMFSATSMDIATPVSFWLALLISFLGWRKGNILSVVGGVLAGVALLMNFLFLFFALVFLVFFICRFKEVQTSERITLVKRGVWTITGFLGFLVMVYEITGYSPVANFLVANAVHHGVVSTGASSAVTYLLFALINLVAFFLFLGVPTVILFFWHGIKNFFTRENILSSFGFFVVLFFVLSGLFQGEVERIWLFLTPLFLPAMYRSIEKSTVSYPVVISLLVLQIVVIQTLFYTYW